MSPFTIFWIFLKLGLTSFGGPVAHIGYFRIEFVSRRAWLTEADYADLVALCQFLPGPASSQVGFAIGLQQGGYLGAFAAFLGFTLPSAAALIAFAYGVVSFDGGMDAGLLAGFKVVAVAVVTQAVLGLGSGLITDKKTAAIAGGALLVLLLWGTVYTQLLVIMMGALAGIFFCRADQPVKTAPTTPEVTRWPTFVFGGLFLLLFLGLPFLASGDDSGAFKLFDGFYRSGALVFGGGHVVLPLLEAETVGRAWLDRDVFIAGYGAAQAVPGPLFTFAGYLGAVTTAGGLPTGIWGAVIALLAIFTPGFLLVMAFLPRWQSLRTNGKIRAALVGVNATVVGLLAAALYDPVITRGILGIEHGLLAAAALIALERLRLPPWFVVLAGAAIGWGVL